MKCFLSCEASLGEQNDLEAKLNALRRYKTEEFIRIGLHDLGGAIEIEPVLNQLSNLAEACLEGAVQLTIEELNQKFGAIPQGEIRRPGNGEDGRKRARL